MDLAERVAEDYRTGHLSLEAHPVALVRPQLERRGALTAAALQALPAGGTATLGGLVIVRQRPPTAKGFTFLSVEDETGIANLVVEPHLFERYRAELVASPLVVGIGRVERAGKVVNLKVTHLEALWPEARRGAPAAAVPPAVAPARPDSRAAGLPPHAVK
jgi:error-prone DNA polymerase